MDGDYLHLFEEFLSRYAAAYDGSINKLTAGKAFTTIN